MNVFVPACINTATGEVHERKGRRSLKPLQWGRRFTATYRDSAQRLSEEQELHTGERLLFLIQERVEAHGHVHLERGQLATLLDRDRSTVDKLIARFKKVGILHPGSTARSLKVNASVFDYSGPGPRVCKRCPDDFLRLDKELGKRFRQDGDADTSRVLA